MDNVKVKKLLSKVRVQPSENITVNLIKFLKNVATMLSDKEIDNINYMIIEHKAYDQIKIKKINILSDEEEK